MKLIITQPEIEAIVRAHVEATVQLREGADMDIEFTATRSDDGITATINIPYMGVAGIPAIAAAADAAKEPAAAPGPSPAAPKPRAPRAAAPKPAPVQNAGSLLGGGTTAATEVPANPEPVKDDVATAEAAGDDAVDAAPFDTTTEAADAVEQVAAAAEEAAPAPVAAQGTTRGPSLFGNSAFKL